VFLTPTVHCLVNVIEYPWFVMSLDDIQIAYFERIAFSLRNFDLVFVFNDWNEKPVQINSIPIESLETIKEWLDQCGIKYYSGKTNLNWRKLLDQISIDPKKFWEDGGWAAFDEGGGDDDGEEVPQEAVKSGERTGAVEGEFRPEDDYRPSGSEESDDYVDSEGSLGGDGPVVDEEDEDVAPEPEEDEGLDWEAMEASFAHEDKRAAMKRKHKGGGYDSDDERPRPLGAPGGRGPVAPVAPGGRGPVAPVAKKPRI